MRGDLYRTFADMAAERGEYRLADSLDNQADEIDQEEAIEEATESLQSYIDAVEEILNQVPRDKKIKKHDEECWKRHSNCLATKLLSALGYEPE